jgi:hypothetical protein
MYGLIPIRFLAESVEAGASIWQITGQETDIVRRWSVPRRPCR